MAAIFISHSGQDSEAPAAIGERIRRERPTWSLFYDKANVRAGQRWQERLREELTSCRVVLALLSCNWLGSPWCFAEAVTAAFRGKDLVGIEIEDLTTDDLARAPPILHERQRVRLRDGDSRVWQEVLEALDRSGLDPDDGQRSRTGAWRAAAAAGTIRSRYAPTTKRTNQWSYRRAAWFRPWQRFRTGVWPAAVSMEGSSSGRRIMPEIRRSCRTVPRSIH